MCAARATTRRVTTHWRVSSDFQHGCGATQTFSISSAGYATITLPSHGRKTKLDFTVSTFTVFMVRFKRCLRILTKWIAPPPNVRQRYSCLEHFGENPQGYGYATYLNLERSCEDEVVKELIELQRAAPRYLSLDGRVAEDELFFAEQNARIVLHAEEYYRSMFQGDIISWNLRDRHMTETLNALCQHLDKRVGRAKLIVWEHNSHLGDARATEMGERGEFNVGQLVREQYHNE